METVLYQFHFNFMDFIWSFIPLIVGLGFFNLGGAHSSEKPGTEIRGNRGHGLYLVSKIAGWIIGMFCFLMFMSLTLVYISDYNDIKNMIASNDLYEVDGYVENYHPMPAEGHDSERFDINGEHFEYSDFEVKNGYHNAASLGGVITKNGQHLKIKYYENRENENVIVYIAQMPE